MNTVIIELASKERKKKTHTNIYIPIIMVCIWLWCNYLKQHCMHDFRPTQGIEGRRGTLFQTIDSRRGPRVKKKKRRRKKVMKWHLWEGGGMFAHNRVHGLRELFITPGSRNLLSDNHCVPQLGLKAKKVPMSWNKIFFCLLVVPQKL